MGDFGGLFMMDVLLVVLEELKFLQCERIRFQCHLKTVCRLRGALYVWIFGFVDCSDEVECVPQSALFSAP